MSSATDTSVDHPPDRPTEDSPADHPPTTTDDVTPADAPSDTPSDTDPETQLLTDDQVEALKDDPVKLRKELQRAFTRKTQKLADERRELEPFRDLIAAYREDPAGTIEDLARQSGLEVRKPSPADSPTSDPVADAKKVLLEALGPEYEDLAEKLGPAISKVAQLEAARISQPLQEAQALQLQTAMVREADNEMKTFGDTHPDWKQFEPEMTRLATVIEPKRGAHVDPQEFLDILYTRAKAGKAVADATKKVITKMTKASEASSAEPGAVGADKVALAPNTPPTFRQAAEFARRGQRLE
jgi:hypothetical protein